MVILRNKQAENFVKNPTNEINGILLHGQDEGLISQRTHDLINFYVKNKGDPFSLIRLNNKLINDDDELLENEINTFGLMGDRKVILIELSSDLNAKQVEAINKSTGDPLIIIKAGELKSTSRLKLLCDKDQNLISIPCYQITSNDLSSLLNEKLSEMKLSMDTSAKQLIINSLGRNYLESVTEINKLLDPFTEEQTVSREHVEKLLVTSENIIINDLVDCVFERKTQKIGSIHRAVLQNLTSSQILIIINNHLIKLLEMLNEKAIRNLSNKEVIERTKPPIFFKRHPSFINQLSIWNIAQINKCLELITEAITSTRHNTELADEITERVLLKISTIKN